MDHTVLPLSPAPGRQAALRHAAQQIESTFLAEMLEAAGLGDTRGAFGGGAGEGQFSSFLVQAQADAMAAAGGVGLTELLFNALVERDHER